jgi:hypothetical protein
MEGGSVGNVAGAFGVFPEVPIMNDREKLTVQREARVRAGDPRRTDGRVQGVNRYLSAFFYLDAHARRERPAETQLQESPADTGSEEHHLKGRGPRTSAGRP